MLSMQLGKNLALLSKLMASSSIVIEFRLKV